MQLTLADFYSSGSQPSRVGGRIDENCNLASVLLGERGNEKAALMEDS